MMSGYPIIPFGSMMNPQLALSQQYLLNCAQSNGQPSIAIEKLAGEPDYLN